MTETPFPAAPPYGSAPTYGIPGPIGPTGPPGVTFPAAVIDSGGQVYNVLAYGAVGNGVADDTLAIQAAINAADADGGGVVFLPQGIYQITSELTITGQVGIVGAGANAATMGGPTGAPLSGIVSLLRWAGPTSTATALLHVEKTGAVCGGMTFRDFAIDGGWTATATGVGYGMWFGAVNQAVVEHVSIFRCRTNCLRLEGNTFTNCMMNQFTRVMLIWCEQPLYLGGRGAGPNTCHNNFTALHVEHGLDPASTTSGMFLGDCDNNTFTGVFVYRRAGTGYGVELANLGAHVNNIFFHLQAGLGGLVARTGVVGDQVYQYSRDNGQPQPTLETGTQVTWTSGGSGGLGWYVNNTLELSDQRIGHGRIRLYHTGQPLDTDYTRMFLGDLGGDPGITVEDGGAAPVHNLRIGTVGAGWIYFLQNNTNVWRITPQLLAHTDNQVDIGTSSNNRPRSIYAATSVVAPMVNTPLLSPTGNVVEQYNGTTAQTLNIYNSFTNASNYERLTIQGTGGTAYQILTGQLGTGAAHNLRIGGGLGAALLFRVNNTDYWQMNTSGHLMAQTDNQVDIGAAGATRPRNIFVSSAVVNRTKAGTPVDADVTTPTDGMLIIDTTASKIWARIGGVWKQTVALT